MSAETTKPKAWGSYYLTDVITGGQFQDLLNIIRQEGEANRPPHRAIMQYINASPAILENCRKVGLMPDFFGYQIEAIVMNGRVAGGEGGL